MPTPPEHQPNHESHDQERPSFDEKFRELLPGVEFTEPAELLEARTAVAEALAIAAHDPEFMRPVWIAYADIAEAVVDSNTQPQERPILQITAIVHKALVFREANIQERYREELVMAEAYAYNEYLDDIADAIGQELSPPQR